MSQVLALLSYGAVVAIAKRQINSIVFHFQEAIGFTGTFITRSMFTHSSFIELTTGVV